MKNLLLFITMVMAAAACNQSDSKSNTATTASITPEQRDVALIDSANYTSIQWLDSTHQELGKIKEGQTPEISWKFKNVGNKPLIVVNAMGTCGCTVAEKPEQPVMPGEEGVIKAKFTSEGRIGTNDKQVMVTTNTKERNTHTLSFRVEVEKE